MSKKTQAKKAVKSQPGNRQNKQQISLPEMEPRFSGRIFTELNSYLEISILSLVIAATAFILYFSNFDNNIVYCDDNIFIERFTKDIPLSETIDTTIGTTFYRPVLNASFILDAKSATKEGVDITKLPPADEREQLDAYVYPEVYQRTNLFFHIAGSILVLLTLVILRFPVLQSFILSLIFTVHPVLTPAVGWISGRNDSMITVFLLLSFIFFVAFLEAKNNKNSIIFITLHLFFFLISLFTKEIGIVFPFLCLMYVPYHLMYNTDRKILKNKALIAIPLWGIAGIAWYMLRRAAMSKIASPDEIGLDALIKNFNSIPAMIGKIFIPHKMIALSSFEMFSILTGWFFIFALIAVFVLLVRKSGKKDSFRNSYKVLWGFAWFVVLLFPTLMIRIQFVDDFFDYAEHRAYLPMVGIFIIVSQLLVLFKVNFRRAIPLAIGLIVFAAFAVKSYTYKDSFRDRIAFWSRMVETYPEKSRGYYDLGLGYKALKDHKKAEELFFKAMERNPGNKKIYYELMSMYDKNSEFDKLEQTAQLTFKNIEPTNPVANFYYGKSLFNRGKKPQSVPYLENAVRFGKQFPPQWLVLLGNAYTYAGKIQESQKMLERALKAREIPDARLYMGMNYYLMNDKTNAAGMFETALSANPRLYLQLAEFYDKQGAFGEVIKIAELYAGKVPKILSPHYYFLAKAYQSTGEPGKAAELLKKGTGEYPGDKNLISLLGDIYLKENQPEKALAEFEKLAEANPNNPDAYYYLGNTYSLMGNNSKAHESFDKALKLDPANGNAYNSKAALYYKEKEFGKAEQLWLQSIKAAPREYGSYINLVKYYKLNDRKPEMDKIVNELTKNGGSLPPDLKEMLK